MNKKIKSRFAEGVLSILTQAYQLWVGNFARLVKLGFVLVTLFFCFRDGEKWSQQLQLTTSYFLNDPRGVYLQTAGNTSRAVVYGLFLAALGQGTIAGLAMRLLA